MTSSLLTDRHALWSTARWVRQELHAGRCPSQTPIMAQVLARLMERSAAGEEYASTALEAMELEAEDLLRRSHLG